MRTSIIRAYALGVLTGTVLTATVLAATPAKADPVSELATAVCSALDREPTVATVSHMVSLLVADGATPFEAGQFIATAVLNNCQRNLPVLEAFVEAYRPHVGRAI